MLVRFLALHAAIGFGIATIFVTALLLADPGGVGALLHPARSGLLPVCLLWLFSGLTFGAAQFAIALGLASEAEPRGGRGSLSASPWAALRPVRVPVPARAVWRPRGPSP
ncbi:hypothetical protein [Roseicella aerolata]|uniref:Uncharacterized protein n=1 Tax=Roseicella aerolata TaxID=2883479 RepID=A0A9X1L9A0_9PROT|nr:hypothetical protein [Roseicella aerolata]MCB4823856.1 hypothetical protein [Roseicella aerolata]